MKLFGCLRYKGILAFYGLWFTLPGTDTVSGMKRHIRLLDAGVAKLRPQSATRAAAPLALTLGEALNATLLA